MKRIDLDYQLTANTLAQNRIFIKLEDLQGKSRVKKLNFHRALVVFMLRKQGYKLAAIGVFLNRNHATIINLTKYSDYKYGRDERWEKTILKLNKYIAEDKLTADIKYHEAKLKELKELLTVYNNQIII